MYAGISVVERFRVPLRFAMLAPYGAEVHLSGNEDRTMTVWSRIVPENVYSIASEMYARGNG